MTYPMWVAGLTTVFVNRDKASDNSEADKNREKDQDQKWDQDRAIVGTEYSSLMTESGAGTDGTVLTGDDPFDSMSHEDIYNKLSGVDSTLVNAAADGWRKLAAESRTAVETFSQSVENSITQSWNGKSGTKAIEATRAFVTSFTSLAAGFQLVGHGLDLMEGHLAQAKGSVGKPDDLTFGDKVVDALPFQNIVKGPSYRAEEAEEQARYVMKTYYTPGVHDVDGRTPTLATVSSKTTDDDKKDEPGSPGTNSPGTGSPGTGSPGTETPSVPDTETPETETPDTETPETETPETDTETPETTTTPQTTPAGVETPTVPQSTTPTTNLPTGTTPGTGVPGTGTPGTGTPGAGTSVPGTLGQTSPTTGTTSNSGRTSGTGRTGMPGMGGAGNRGGGKGDDDDEHSIPDYLIYDHGDELLGSQPPALPPGGVIGG